MSRQFDFQNLDLYSCQDFENLRVVSSEPLKTLVRTADEPVDAASGQPQEEFFYQKSFLIPTQSFQISFEKDFMKEHEAAFQKELRKYLESFRIYLAKVGTDQSNYNKFLNKAQKQELKCIQFIRSHEIGLKPNQSQKFIDKLTNFDKLSQFLNFIVSTCSEKMSIQLIQIAKKLLEKYEKILIQLPSQQELIDAAQEIAKNLNYGELLGLRGVTLIKCKEAKNFVQSSIKFMEVYCATTILVIAQYFENPYCSEQIDCYKRQLSPCYSEDEESEEEIGSRSMKKRKFSF